MPLLAMPLFAIDAPASAPMPNRTGAVHRDEYASPEDGNAAEAKMLHKWTQLRFARGEGAASP